MPSARRARRIVLIPGLVLAAVLVVSSWTLPARAANTNVNVQVCPSTPYPPPVINSPADGTSTTASSIAMTGQATPNATVYAYRNDIQVGFVSSGNDGNFAISISLVMGLNELKASTNNECSAPTFSNTVTVERREPHTPGEDPDDPPTFPPIQPDEEDEQLPGLSEDEDDRAADEDEEDREDGAPSDEPEADPYRPSITRPRNGDRFTNPDIIIRGRTASNLMVRVFVNNQAVAGVLSDDEGRFMVNVTLIPGANQLVARVAQDDKAQSSDPIVVFYDQPSYRDAPVLRAAVATTTAVAAIATGLAVYSMFVRPPSFLSAIRRFLKGLVSK